MLSRVQNDGTSNDPAEYHLYASGVQVADYTNDNNEEVQNYDYQALITSKTNPGASGTGRFYQGTSAGTSGGEFGTSGYDPTNQITAGVGVNSRSAYVVQSGDTLQSIAQFEWGDASLWYLIANANGLSADAPLAAGQSLALPLKGPSNVNNASMYRPYDPQGAVGDLSPTSVKPPKGNKCGAFGQVLLVAIAVAATAVTAGAAAAAIGPASGILGGLGTLADGSLGVGAGIAIGAGSAAVGSVVSQGVGLASGIQQGGFSFKQVALAALAGGIGGGIAASPGLQGGGILGAAARGAGSSALTQGVGVVTGLQDKFDWAGVAAAGVAAGVSFGIGKAIGAQPILDDRTLGNYALNAAADMAGAIANAASRSVINGNDFGDNIIAALPDVIGNTIGNLLVDGVSSSTAAAAGATGEKDTVQTGEAGGKVGGSTDAMGVSPMMMGLVAISAEKVPSLNEILAAGGADPLAPLPDPLAPLPPGPRVDVDVTGLLASSTEVTFQGEPIYDGDILVVGVRSRTDIIQQVGDIIAGGEGGYEAYNTGTKDVLGGKVGYSNSHAPAGTVTGKTIDQILSTDGYSGTDRRRMFATGKYQTIIPTLRLAKEALNLTGNEPYTPELQERVFRDYLLKEQAPGLYDFIVKGTGTAIDAQYAASKTWASIAVPKGLPDKNGIISNGSRSYYEGSANHAIMASTNSLKDHSF